MMQMQPFSFQHKENHISKRNYEISLVQAVHISWLELQRWSFEFVIFFSKVYIWDLGIQISIRQKNFQYIFSPKYEKIKSFAETFTSHNKILIFEEQLCMSNMDFYIW